MVGDMMPVIVYVVFFPKNWMMMLAVVVHWDD